MLDTTSSKSVEAWLSASDHPLKLEILAVRQFILDAAPGISEGVKWNAPNFCTSTDFATFQLRSGGAVQLILHFGAKRRPEPISSVDIADPEQLLNWLGPDRAAVKFWGMADVKAKQAAFTAIVRQWIAQIEPDSDRSAASAGLDPANTSTPEVHP
jgi:hypothetical protein